LNITKKPNQVDVNTTSKLVQLETRIKENKVAEDKQKEEISSLKRQLKFYQDKIKVDLTEDKTKNWASRKSNLIVYPQNFNPDDISKLIENNKADKADKSIKVTNVVQYKSPKHQRKASVPDVSLNYKEMSPFKTKKNEDKEIKSIKNVVIDVKDSNDNTGKKEKPAEDNKTKEASNVISKKSILKNQPITARHQSRNNNNNDEVISSPIKTSASNTANTTSVNINESISVSSMNEIESNFKVLLSNYDDELNELDQFEKMINKLRD